MSAVWQGNRALAMRVMITGTHQAQTTDRIGEQRSNFSLNLLIVVLIVAAALVMGFLWWWRLVAAGSTIGFSCSEIAFRMLADLSDQIDAGHSDQSSDCLYSFPNLNAGLR
jgi:hypothetical protein